MNKRSNDLPELGEVLLSVLFLLGMPDAVGATALGSEANDIGDDTNTSLGASSATLNTNGTAAGFDAQVWAEWGSAFGANSRATGTDATAIGAASEAAGVDSVAVGAASDATGDNSVALGQYSWASADETIAIGQLAQAFADGAIAIGHRSVADQPNTVSFGDSDTQRRITNLADGVDSSDGATIGQLSGAFTHAEAVAETAEANASAYADAVTAEADASARSYTDSQAAAVSIYAEAVADMAETNANAYTDLQIAQRGCRLSQGLYSCGTGLAAAGIAIGSGAVASSNPAVAIGVNAHAAASSSVAVGTQATTVADATRAVALGAFSRADRSDTVSVGNAQTGLTRQITNVADGTEALDAVNKQQLDRAIEGARVYAARGIAAVLAQPASVAPSVGRLFVGLQYGYYDGEHAIGIGYSARPSASLVLNAGVSSDSSGSQIATRAGFGVIW